MNYQNVVTSELTKMIENKRIRKLQKNDKEWYDKENKRNREKEMKLKERREWREEMRTWEKGKSPEK